VHWQLLADQQQLILPETRQQTLQTCVLDIALEGVLMKGLMVLAILGDQFCSCWAVVAEGEHACFCLLCRPGMVVFTFTCSWTEVQVKSCFACKQAVLSDITLDCNNN